MATRRVRRLHKRIKTHRKKHSRRTRRTQRGGMPPLSKLVDQLNKLGLGKERDVDPQQRHNSILYNKFPLCLRTYIKSRNLPFEEEVQLTHAIAKELSNLHTVKGQTTQQTLGIVPGTSNPLAENCPKLQEFLEHLERTSSASAPAASAPAASVPVEANADMIARLQAVLDDEENSDMIARLQAVLDD